ncbi:mitochondrial intermembrane space import and assembly protein 40 homolog [Neltuma alba]|uniref:mitochondrial intermembrane space import and assembly protein 40 homolog n=1 Tax=Neltuma alba TaxID=207710 RepID=UPI0010A48900|nr:mitochondrial intermembrane space import and assembly protein 40 homolog [Prosopis alba]XP_028797049.1 mitochondrial intermembrane space import and assembly protein 40 homolog [Prosopis alba]
MGQTMSADAAPAAAVKDETTKSNSTSLETAIADAVAYGNEGTESVEVKAKKALECPCIADLRSGPCGNQFSEAFLCFLKSTAEEKGSDCVHPFVALQNCIKANPNAFPEDILNEGEVEETEPAQEYKIIPPTWSRESRNPKPKL